MKAKNAGLLQIHVAVFLFGLSGLFGKLVTLPAGLIVFGRVVFASIFLILLLVYLRQNIKLNQQRHYVYLAVMGMLLAVHWVTFFLSIQVATVAIGLLTFSTFPVFVTFLEPYFFKEKIRLADIIAALLTLGGVILVIPEFQLNNSVTQGVVWGITSGFTYAVLSLLNRNFAAEYSSLVIAFYEQAAAAILLFPFVFLRPQPVVQVNDILLLLLLGVVFTGVSHSLFISGLKRIKTQTAGIISSLEPVYGIIFAVMLLQEIPTLREILGGLIILGTVVYKSIDAGASSL
ncbi:DMT family transporter [Sporomusa termitida]|uniref:2A78: carboxylate/amino acid/amine transporter n=1 Tax=Sporomusa termitida TaxID=2377 RepID=A0A517DWC4_9FIRM|nr:DMT family transporter [Sporomusa termitida]QDR81654.1 2A78: carboxylate/amino acid/amine transporter [Sporomusa termitida]